MAPVDPYIKKDPNDLIRSGDWNEIQVRARQEIRAHTHKGDTDGTQIPREGIQPNAIDGTRIDPASRVTVAQLKVVDRDLLADINTLIARANTFDSRLNALDTRANALDAAKVNRAGDTIAGALRVNGGLALGGAGSTLELGAGVAKGGENGKIAYARWSEGLDIVGAGTTTANRKVTVHAQGGGTDFVGPIEVQGGATIQGDLKVTGGHLRNAGGFAIIQTNANDWLRVNMEQSYPAIALYKPVAIGTGGLAVGSWAQLPQGQLHVTDDARIGGGLTVTGGAITPRVGNSAQAGIQFPINPGGGGGDEAFIRYYVLGGETTKLLIGTGNDADDTVGFWQAGGERLTIYNGNVGINHTAPQAELHIRQDGGGGIRLEEHGGTGRHLNIYYEGQGTVVFYHQNGQGQFMRQDGVWNRNSDLALKDNVAGLQGMLDKVMRLKPVSFDWKATGTRDIGFVAQDVERVFPELVSSVRLEATGDREVKGLAYDTFGVVAISALQELKARYDQRLEVLEQALQALTARRG